ncbi:MAG TPA: glycosyl transferase family 1 [Acholeplasmataceae bacterium]|nr:glycosyl transferase family 1 [Acholeplasmataceae bacterium]
MNIALLHYRVGETDGVSLEMDKWRQVLISMGNQVFYVAGNHSKIDAYVIEEIGFNNPLDLKIASNCYEKLIDYTPSSLKEAIEEQAKIIENKLSHFIKTKKIDLIIPNNVFALGRSIPIAKGILNAIEQTHIQVICHHHDFYWERERYSHPQTDYVLDSLNHLFPPIHYPMQHVVINSYAQKSLMEKKGLTSTIVPNVFDFDLFPWIMDAYNADFKESLGVNQNQVLILQATRVVNRKAIELAIDVVDQMNQMQHKRKWIGKKLYDGRTFDKDTEFVLAVLGLHEGTDHYEDKLIEHAASKNVHMIMNPNLVDHTRYEKNNKKIYSLWDAYVHADLITYPSIYEGFGNQFLEGLFAKKPMIVFEYSVFEQDIKSKGFSYVSLGNTYITKDNGLVECEKKVTIQAAQQAMKYLCDTKYRNQEVEKNYRLGQLHYSMNTLKKIIETL